MNSNSKKRVRKPGEPKSEHIRALSFIYRGYKRLGELERSRYDEARKQILSGIVTATKAMELGERLAG